MVLQRGHALTRMESVSWLHCACQATSASTGPRAHAHGELLRPFARSFVVGLQRGHALTRMESSEAARSRRSSGAGFNGATRSRAWRADANTGVAIAADELQRGHVLTRMERRTTAP